MKRRYFKELRFQQIQSLVELHRRGTFAEVARSLQISVPSVWQQIRGLEDEFKVRLALTHGKKVTLTADGLLLAELSATVVEGFNSLRLAFAERQKGLKRELTLATTSSFLAYDLPPIVVAYRNAHPDVQLTFIERPSHEALAILEQTKADIAIVGFDSLPDSNSRYRIDQIASYSAHLVCPDDHALLSVKRLTLARIARHPLVLPASGGVLRERAMRLFAQAGLNETTVSLSANTPTIVNSYVRMGYGVGLVSYSPVLVAHWNEYGGHGLQLRDVSKLFGKEPIAMIYRAKGHEFSHVRAFRETVVTVMKRYAESLRNRVEL